MLNEIILGDWFEVISRIPDGSIDLIATDLPYQQTRNSWDKLIPTEVMWPQVRRVLKPTGKFITTGNQPFTTLLIASNLNEFHDCLVWEKTNPTGHLNANRRPMRAHEDIIIFARKTGTYNPQKTTGHERKVSTANHKRNSKATTNYGVHGLTTYDSTERFPRTVLRFKSDTQKSALHETQKPQKLYEWLLKSYSNPGDTVLDFCCGSGTTAAAALATGRNFICCDNSPEYIEKARDRVYPALELAA